MKPPHFPGEGSWAHEVKQALRDKLRWAYGTAGAARPAAASRAAGPSHGDDCRGSAAEDPIRRVMFLAPWGHT